MTASWILLLAQAALRALVAAVLVGAVLRLLRVTNVLAEKAVWGLVLLAAIALPLAPAHFRLPETVAARTAAIVEQARTAWSHWRSMQHGSAAVVAPAAAEPAALATTASTSAAPEVVYEYEPVETAAAQAAQPAPEPVLASKTSAPPQWVLPRWAKIGALCFYLGVAAALFFRLAVGLFAALRLWWGSKPVECAAALGIRVRASERVGTPVTVGSGVLLPASYLSWSPEKLRIVLAHEQSHIRQGDFYLQLAAGIYAALIWPSPLGWWLRHRLSELGEAISDRAGLEAAASRTSYAQLLLEIAALPRPTGLGVAMAQPSRLSHRIERLLNETSFTKAFTASRRALAAVVVVPVALLASAAMVQVYAAVPQQDQSKPADQPTSIQVQVDTNQPPAPPTEPGMMPPPPPPPQDGMQGQMAPPPPPAGDGPGMAPPPPPAGMTVEADGPDGMPMQMTVEMGPGAHQRPMVLSMRRPFGTGPDGEPYALVGDEKRLMPGFSPEQLDKARKMAHGHFLLFHHNGKVYLVDDAATVKQLETAEFNTAEQEKRMREQGRMMSEQGRLLSEQARQMQINVQVKVPDLTNEMADVNKALAELKAKQGTSISPQELGELERKLGELQRKLGRAQFDGMKHMNIHLDDTAMKQMEEKMSKLGDQLSVAFRSNNEKVNSVIEESLKNGKARPVE